MIVFRLLFFVVYIPLGIFLILLEALLHATAEIVGGWVEKLWMMDV
jgi:hypothetical protein